MRWERLQQVGDGGAEMGGGFGPGKRWGHTCNAIKGGKQLYVFGGYGRDNCQTNQVHVFDTVKRSWSEPVIKGTPPTPRDSHSCTSVGDNLFVFGGTDGMNPLRDLHILDTTTHTWISPSLRGEGPEAREGHNAALIGKRLFIFGGCGKSANNSDEVYYNDLYILNTETFVWKRAMTSGTPPSARDSHSCSSWRNKIIVIGGEDEHDYYLSDVHILDADTLVWRELDTSGQMLPPRAGHSTVAFGKNLFVFGGFTDAQNLYDDLHMLDVDTGVWTKVTATGDGPSARFSVAGDSLDPVKGGVLVFIGGCNKHLEALDDMYYLYTELARENGRDERRMEKLSLRKQLKLKCQEQNHFPAAQNNALLRIGPNADLCQPIPVRSYGQPSMQNFPSNEYQPFQGKKTFQAKVSQSFSDGYTIETVIDGKPLRGILFSNRPSTFHAVTTNSSRKRVAAEVGGAKLNNDIKGTLRTVNPIKQDATDHRQTDGVLEKESTPSEPQKASAAAAAILKNSATPDASQPEKAPGNPESTLEDDMTNDVAKSSINVSEVNAPVVPTPNFENDKTNDIAKSGIKVSEDNASMRVSDCVALPQKQDDKTPISKELNRPAKSI